MYSTATTYVRGSTSRDVAKGGGLGGLGPPREQRQKISVSCRSTEYGCDVVYIRKRLNIFCVYSLLVFLVTIASN